MLSVAMDAANTTMAKTIIVISKLTQKLRAGIALHSACSAPSTIITAQVKMAQVMVGIPTITNRINNLPFTLNTPSLDSQRA